MRRLTLIDMARRRLRKSTSVLGFSLLEMIIYTGIVSFILVAMVEIASIVQSSRARVVINDTLHATAARVLNTVDTLVRNSGGFVRDASSRTCVFTKKLWLYYATSSIGYLPPGCMGNYTSGAVAIEPYSFSGATTTSPDSPFLAREGYGMAIDSKYLYSVGALNNGWHISKRYLDDMKYDTGFDGDGAVSTSGNYAARSIASDGQFLYIVGGNQASLTTNDYRIEKRRISDGSLDTAFDTDGIITSANAQTLYSVAVDSSNMYAVGYKAGASSSSGPNNGSTFANDNNGFTMGNVSWSNPSNAQTSNNVRATAAFTVGGDTSNYLKATGFGFSIPTDATINGIKVEVERSISVQAFNTVTDNSVKIVQAGTIGGNEKANGSSWTTTDTYDTYGGTTDLWGLTWTAAAINASNFGAVISATAVEISDTTNAQIDHIRITVSYTAANDWYIEKRSVSTGALDTGFDTDGIITVTGGTANDIAIDIPNNWMYVAGVISSVGTVEKRLLTTGAKVAAFTAYDGPQATGVTYRSIVLDGGNLFVTGDNGSDLRIEKRSTTDGSLVTAFGSSGAVTAASVTTSGYGIAVGGDYLFTVGHSSNDWYLEKRSKTTGSLVTNFGTGGTITGSTSTDIPYAGALVDDDYVYILGTSLIGSTRYQYVEKRSRSSGNLDERNGLRLLCFQHYPNNGNSSTCYTDPPHARIARHDLTDSLTLFVGLDDFSVSTTTTGSRQAIEVELKMKYLGSGLAFTVATYTASTTQAFRISSP